MFICGLVFLQGSPLHGAADKQNQGALTEDVLSSPEKKLNTNEELSDKSSAVPDLKRKLEEMTLLYRETRKQLGILSCETKGIGPTGGFCLKKEAFHVGGNQLWCPLVAEELRTLFAKQTVYDFGAGLGWYGKVFTRPSTTNDTGPSLYLGFDGAENVEEVTEGFIKWADLTQQQHMEPADWILSFEVGEHIPPQYEEIFLQNLHGHNKKGVVLSWGVEGQGGHFHVNNHNNDYVKAKFASLGYTNDISEEEKLRKISTLTWFQNTIMVFRKEK